MRDAKIDLRLKGNEKEKVRAYADSIGLSMSALLRTAVLKEVKGGPLSPNTRPPESPKGDQHDNTDGP